MARITRKAWLLITAAVIVAAAVIAYLAWPAFKQRVGDIRPALLPPKKAITNSDLVNLDLPLGFKVGLYATGLGRARDVAFSPGGTLLVSLPGANKIVALPDANNDGESDDTITAIGGLRNPHGIAFFNGKLFVAEERQVVRYTWNEKTKQASVDKKLFDLPKGGNHTSRTIAFDGEGKMLVSVGSTCNVCREAHEFLAAVIVSDADGKTPRVFAKGLRNAPFLATNPTSGAVWATEMGRDFLGDNLPPDEINIVQDGKDYGWPNCYGNQVPDKSFNAGATCGSTASPVFDIDAHAAPLGLLFIDSKQFPQDWQGDLLVAYHGSFNSSVPKGYKVVRLIVEGDKVIKEEPFITGFLAGSRTLGRPVDMAFDREGSLFLSDDKAGAIYKIIR